VLQFVLAEEAAVLATGDTQTLGDEFSSIDGVDDVIKVMPFHRFSGALSVVHS
jgi:hypothetical protein